MTFSNHVNSKKELYQNAIQAAGLEQVVIGSGQLQYRFQDDMPVPFVCSGYFREWLPLTDQTDCYILLTLNADKPKLLYKVVADYWHSAPKALSEQIMQAFDVIEYSEDSQLSKHFSNSANTALIGEANSLSSQFDQWQVNPGKVSNYIDYHRAWKTDYELDCMRHANRIAHKGHAAAEQAFRAGKSELDIHIAYLHAVQAQDNELPYGSIVALNENAAVLHHTVLNKQAVTPRSFLLDAGAQYNGYASDITRTHLKDESSPEFTELLKQMHALELNLVKLARPDTNYQEIHISAYREIGQLLVNNGIIKTSLEQAIETNLVGAFFPHGVGHLLGCQVHDRGGHLADVEGTLRPPQSDYPFLRCTRDIEANMVFTIEPGVYFIPMLLAQWREGTQQQQSMVDWSLVDELLPYGGIRIEDNIIVHKDRIENMTRDVFGD